jgi:hypothetical protein
MENKFQKIDFAIRAEKQQLSGYISVESGMSCMMLDSNAQEMTGFLLWIRRYWWQPRYGQERIPSFPWLEPEGAVDDGMIGIHCPQLSFRGGSLVSGPVFQQVCAKHCEV